MSAVKYYLYVNGKHIEVTEELYTYYMRSEWRNQYRDVKLKNGRIVVDNDNSTMTFEGSKEVSLDSLLDQGAQIPDTSEPFDEVFIRNTWLYEALNKLSLRDRYIITQLYFEQKTETELAKELGVSQAFIHKKKVKILDKLHELLEIL